MRYTFLGFYVMIDITVSNFSFYSSCEFWISEAEASIHVQCVCWCWCSHWIFDNFGFSIYNIVSFRFTSLLFCYLMLLCLPLLRFFMDLNGIKRKRATMNTHKPTPITITIIAIVTIIRKYAAKNVLFLILFLSSSVSASFCPPHRHRHNRTVYVNISSYCWKILIPFVVIFCRLLKLIVDFDKTKKKYRR